MTENKHPLPKGTWIRSLVPVSDSGDYNERTAKAGALGRIEEVVGRGGAVSYAIVFQPSFISNTFDQDEIDREAEVLPVGHPDIPPAGAFHFANAVADIVAEGEIDEDERTVEIPAEVCGRIMSGPFPDGLGAVEMVIIASTLKSKAARYKAKDTTITFEQFDRLAGIAGVADRLCEAEAETTPAM